MGLAAISKGRSSPCFVLRPLISQLHAENESEVAQSCLTLYHPMYMGATLSLKCEGFLLQWLPLLQSTGLWGLPASVIVAPGL